MWKQSVDTVTKKVQTLDLLAKDLKSAILDTFKELKEIMPKELKDIMGTMSHKIENINKEINC